MWKRFSELRKLHGELAFTHKNLFRREEEFPPFPRAQVFGITEGILNQNTQLLIGLDSASFQVLHCLKYLMLLLFDVKSALLGPLV